MKLQSDIIIAKNLLTRKTGQLVYLKNLAKVTIQNCPLPIYTGHSII